MLCAVVQVFLQENQRRDSEHHAQRVRDLFAVFWPIACHC